MPISLALLMKNRRCFLIVGCWVNCGGGGGGCGGGDGDSEYSFLFKFIHIFGLLMGFVISCSHLQCLK